MESRNVALSLEVNEQLAYTTRRHITFTSNQSHIHIAFPQSQSGKHAGKISFLQPMASIPYRFSLRQNAKLKTAMFLSYNIQVFQVGFPVRFSREVKCKLAPSGTPMRRLSSKCGTKRRARITVRCYA
jgi:hypothetical protein